MTPEEINPSGNLISPKVWPNLPPHMAAVPKDLPNYSAKVCSEPSFSMASEPSGKAERKGIVSMPSTTATSRSRPIRCSACSIGSIARKV